MFQLQHQIDRIFDEFQKGLPSMAGNFSPVFDLEELDDHYVLSVDLPGLDKEDIKVECSNNQLVISGERKESNKRGNRRSERTYGFFQRSFTLPEGVKLEEIVAEYRDGVLQVAVPKTQEAHSREIKIGEPKPGFFDRLLGRDPSKVEESKKGENKEGEERVA